MTAAAGSAGQAPPLAIENVVVRRKGARLLDRVTWRVEGGEHWALLGPNGAGKSTLLTLVAAVEHPTSGHVELLGERLGRTDVRRLRERIVSVDARLDRRLLPDYEVETIVLTGATGTRVPVWERIDDETKRRARALLELLGCSELAARPLATCSQGERQRVLIARALMMDPEILLLDEPAVALDLPAREALVAAVASAAREHPELTTVIATHHLEGLPPTTTHALLLRHGRVVAAGPAAEVLRAEALSETFGMPVEVGRQGERWWARAPAGWSR